MAIRLHFGDTVSLFESEDTDESFNLSADAYLFAEAEEMRRRIEKMLGESGDESRGSSIDDNTVPTGGADIC
jgi:hypothetical protein